MVHLRTSDLALKNKANSKEIQIWYIFHSGFRLNERDDFVEQWVKLVLMKKISNKVFIQYAGPVEFLNIIKPKIYEGNRFTKKMPKGTFTMRLYEGIDDLGNRIENTYTGTKTQLKKIFDQNNRGRVAGDLPTIKDGEVYKIRQGANKGKFAIRMPKDDAYSFFDTEELAEQYKTNYLNDPANKVGGDRTSELENKKYSKGYKTKNQFIEFLKTKYIDIKNPAAFARTYGINTKVNPYNANALIYDTSEFKNKNFVNNIIQRQVKVGGGTESQKLQFKKLIK